MKGARYTEEQIVAALPDAEATLVLRVLHVARDV